MTETIRQLTELSQTPSDLAAWLEQGVMNEDPRLTLAVAWLGEQDEVGQLVHLFAFACVHGDTRVQSAIRHALNGRDAAIDAVLREDFASEAAEVRRQAATVAGRLGCVELVPDLCELLVDPYPLARAEAAIALGQLGSPGALEKLRQSVHDVDRHVGLAAVESLLRLKDPDLAKVLSGGFDEDGIAYRYGVLDSPHVDVRRAVFDLLLTYRPGSAATVLKGYISDAEELAPPDLAEARSALALISAALAVLICQSPKGDTSERFQALWPRGRRMPTSWSCCV